VAIAVPVAPCIGPEPVQLLDGNTAAVQLSVEISLHAHKQLS
jgi:hypothetical protein